MTHFFLLYFPGMRVRLFRNKGFNENAVPLFHFLSWSSSRTDLLQIICLFKDTSFEFFSLQGDQGESGISGKKGGQGPKVIYDVFNKIERKSLFV